VLWLGSSRLTSGCGRDPRSRARASADVGAVRGRADRSAL